MVFKDKLVKVFWRVLLYISLLLTFIVCFFLGAYGIKFIYWLVGLVL